MKQHDATAQLAIGVVAPSRERGLKRGVGVTLRQDVQTPLRDKFPPLGKGKSFINGRLHSLRHFFCSYCANNNVPERTAMKWLGHSNSRMIKRYYNLKDDESVRRMASPSFVSEAMSSGNAICTTVVPTPSL